MPQQWMLMQRAYNEGDTKSSPTGTYNIVHLDTLDKFKKLENTILVPYGYEALTDNHLEPFLRSVCDSTYFRPRFRDCDMIPTWSLTNANLQTKKAIFLQMKRVNLKKSSFKLNCRTLDIEVKGVNDTFPPTTARIEGRQTKAARGTGQKTKPLKAIKKADIPKAIQDGTGMSLHVDTDFSNPVIVVNFFDKNAVKPVNNVCFEFYSECLPLKEFQDDNPDHPVIRYAKGFTNRLSKSYRIFQKIFGDLQSESTQARNARGPTANIPLLDLLQKCNANIHMEYSRLDDSEQPGQAFFFDVDLEADPVLEYITKKQHPPDDNPEAKPPDHTEEPKTPKSTKETRFIKFIFGIFEWTTAKIIKKAQYLSLDCSWSPVKPYTYCIVNAIYNNRSIPIGFMIGPSESSELYTKGLDWIQQSILLRPYEPPKEGKPAIPQETIPELKMMPIISDGGKALRAAFANNPRHYFCHHHFIKLFGAHSYAGAFARLLVDASISEENWSREAPLLLNTIQEIHETNKAETAKGTISPFGKHYKRLLCMAKGEDEPKQNGVKFHMWATFHRLESHVQCTQNFNESAHSHINKYYREAVSKVRGRRNRFKAGYYSINTYCLARSRKFRAKFNRTVVDRLNLLEAWSKANPQIENCQCGDSEWHLAIYGLDMKCAHQYHLIDRDDLISLSEAQAFDLPPTFGPKIVLMSLSKTPLNIRRTKKKQVPNVLSGWQQIKHHPIWEKAKQYPALKCFVSSAKITALMTSTSFEDVLYFLLDNFPSNYEVAFDTPEYLDFHHELLQAAIQNFIAADSDAETHHPDAGQTDRPDADQTDPPDADQTTPPPPPTLIERLTMFVSQQEGTFAPLHADAHQSIDNLVADEELEDEEAQLIETTKEFLQTCIDEENLAENPWSPKSVLLNSNPDLCCKPDTPREKV